MRPPENSLIAAMQQHVWAPTKSINWVYSSRSLTLILVLLSLIAALTLFGLTLGRMSFSFSEVMQTLISPRAGEISEKIILDIRLPRVLTAVLVGMALGISGSIFQSVSRNPLGSPDVIGFTTGAATGALLQIILFDGGALAVGLSAVAGGIVTAAIVYFLAMKGTSVGGYRLVLVGIGIGAILTALNGLLLVNGELDNAIMANLWLAGSLHARTLNHVVPVVLALLILLPLILVAARPLALIEMGDDLARQLGVNIETVRLKMIFYAVILAAVATGAAGPIAFIALAAPQLVIRLVPGQSLPILSAGLMGAFILLLADIITQLLPLKISVPIGHMTGILGGLYLIWLLTRLKRV